MPQELQVLTCYQCETFQVQIVKKVPKWQCKMCGEKQSIKKVYFVGSGKDCRKIVQDLNTRRIQLEEQSIHNIILNEEQENYNNDTSKSPKSEDEEDLIELENKNYTRKPCDSKNKNNDTSKWNTLLPESKDEDHFSEPELEKYTFERTTKKRKKSMQTKQSPTFHKNSKKMANISHEKEQRSTDEESGIEIISGSEKKQLKNFQRKFESFCTSKPAEAKFSKWNEDDDDKSDSCANEQITDCSGGEDNGDKSDNCTNEEITHCSGGEDNGDKSDNCTNEQITDCSGDEDDENIDTEAANSLNSTEVVFKQNTRMLDDKAEASMNCIKKEDQKVGLNNRKDLRSVNIFEDDGDLDLGI